MLQIKTFLYFPPSKGNEKTLRQGVVNFFDEINKWLVDKNVEASDIMVSDSTDYIFIHIIYKVRNRKKSK